MQQGFKVHATDLLDRFDNFPRRMSNSVTTVHGTALTARAEVLERQAVHLGEVRDMDIISHARTVPSLVVRSVDLHVWP